MSLHDALGVLPPAHPGDRPHLNNAALYGLAGEVVETFRPHSEADPVSILVAFLAAFGNAVGNSSYVVADGAIHGPRICPVLVGNTSRGRKGTAQANVDWLMGHADPEWLDKRKVSGLASGEGLIAALDPDDDGRLTDPRLFVVEPEFARVLKVAQREGSILSAVLRDAWDRGDLANMTRHAPLRAKGAHITVVGHITAAELARSLTETEAANGFANRFLFFEVGRSQRLPHGGELEDETVKALARKVTTALTTARGRPGRLQRSPEADQLWERAYYAVDDDVPGMLGAVLARTEAQLLRLSMVYALLEGSNVIEAPHLRAAAAVWDHAAMSAGRIFGETAGDPLTDNLLTALRNNTAGLDRTAIRDLFSRNVPGDQISRALDGLAERGLAESETIETGGRPRTVWRTTTETTETPKVPGIIGGQTLSSLMSFSAYPKEEP